MVNQAAKSRESEQMRPHRLSQVPHSRVSVVHVLFPSADTGIYSGVNSSLRVAAIPVGRRELRYRRELVGQLAFFFRNLLKELQVAFAVEPLKQKTVSN